MLRISIPLERGFDNETQKFVVLETFQMDLEHSLVSLSKWESEFEKPFLTKDPKTPEETFAYFKAMCLTPDVPPEVWGKMTQQNAEAINDYIGAKRTATWFNERVDNRPSRETITSELIYYWLVALQIPWEAENWHLNRLMTLIKVCNEKNKAAESSQKGRRLGRKDLDQRAALNRARQQQHGTRG